MTLDELLDRQWALDFAAAKSMRYHSYRRSFWQSLDAWTKAITLLSGTAVLVSFFAHRHDLAEGFAFAVAAFSAADVILGFSKRASEHDGLYRAFCGFRADIVETAEPTEKKIVAWERRRLEIEMDEPGVLDLLERRCAAEEAKARHVPLRESWKLSWWQVVRSQISIVPQIVRPTDTKAVHKT